MVGSARCLYGRIWGHVLLRFGNCLTDTNPTRLGLRDTDVVFCVNNFSPIVCEPSWFNLLDGATTASIISLLKKNMRPQLRDQ
ncbi:unnamed protein product [Acanthocheilonema viteae]|uniref:Uncharacterized protein n=1 Tax=Acanthocheilonema viteae TaxID=6277 RepID=A0A498SBH6_ACAVI|nr:unnamed protein product [Acanthocheilonema viteae]